MAREHVRPLSPAVQACARCKSPIVWARTVASESGAGGRSMPLDAYPDPAGNVAVYSSGGRRPTLRARVLRKDERPDPLERLAMPHFATCEKAAAELAATTPLPSNVVPIRGRNRR
jgi:hypothetical protein